MGKPANAADGQPHIGTLAERSLHAALKERLAQPGDHLEVPVEGFVVDIVRGAALLEIQTAGLYQMKRKLRRLLPEYQITIYHPIPREKWIVRQSADGDFVSRRKSPKKGRVEDVFRELVRFGALLEQPNLTLIVLLTQEEEIWRDDGQGSWRRRRWSIHDRVLLDVIEEVSLATPADLLARLPADLPDPFTNQELARALRIRPRLAQQITYTLRHLDQLALCGKRGRANLHARR